MEIIFTYPFTAVSFYLGYDQVDIVAMNTNNKAMLMTKPEDMVRTAFPIREVHVTIVDAWFLLHALLDLYAKFGSLILC